MIRLLQSSWSTALIGCLIYLGVTAAVLTERMRRALPPDAAARAKTSSCCTA